jgi:DNA uptake protein ComE-like DNA-binding protein
MNFKQIIRDYFTFSRNERKGIIILIILIFLLAVANKVVFYFETPARINTILLDSASYKLDVINDSIHQYLPGQKLFVFDPNTIDSIALDSLDLPTKIKHNLLKFRKKGGGFHSASDFKKLYGLTDKIFLQIKPYLQIENEQKLSSPKVQSSELFAFDPNKATDDEFLRLELSKKQIAIIRNYQNKGGIYKNKEGFFRMWGLREDQKKALSAYVAIEGIDNSHSGKLNAKEISIELNTADSIQLKQLPGIGDKLSKRIVKYRDILGGYYSVSQLKEVYGLNEQNFLLIENKVTLDSTKIRNLDLNFADMNELSRHPYLQKKLARQIIQFRSKNGSIHDLSVLRDSMILNIDDYNRLRPYFQNKKRF